MRRMLIAASTTSVLALGAPALASAAHRSSCRHHHSHRSCATRRAHHAQILTFGSAATTPGTSGTPGASATPATLSASGETAGTVSSFTGGVLTITLKDATSVSGKVTESTELRCQSATPAGETGADDQQGDESSGGNGDSHGGVQGIASRGEDMSSGSDDGEDGQGQPSTCTTAALVPGAVVAEAELSVGSAGAVWDHVDLIQ